MAEADHVLSLVREALDELDSPNGRVSVAARKAVRVARMRGDWRAVYWIQLELNSFDDPRSRKRVIAEVLPYFSKEAIAFLREKTIEDSISSRSVKTLDVVRKRMNDELKVCGFRIAEIEDSVVQFARAATPSYPPNLHPVDAYQMGKENDLVEMASSIAAGELQRVLRRVGERIHTYLSQTESEIHRGRAEPDITEQNRMYVDRRLREVSLGAAGALTAAYRRVREGNVEARSHALTSCRRALKMLADVLYPARVVPALGSDGKMHGVTDDKFVNRLRQFLAESPANAASRELLASSVEEVGQKLDHLNDLASKGVHAAVSEFEVNVCITQTYSVTSALLLLYDGQSAAIGEPPA